MDDTQIQELQESLERHDYSVLLHTTFGDLLSLLERLKDQGTRDRSVGPVAINTWEPYSDPLTGNTIYRMKATASGGVATKEGQ